jgi:hypothetical protein
VIWLAPRCPAGATKAGENGVATSFAARRIGERLILFLAEPQGAETFEVRFV